MSRRLRAISGQPRRKPGLFLVLKGPTPVVPSRRVEQSEASRQLLVWDSNLEPQRERSGRFVWKSPPLVGGDALASSKRALNEVAL